MRIAQVHIKSTYKNLKDFKIDQEDVFKIIIYRSTVEATEQATAEVQKLVKVLEGEMKRAEIQRH